MMAAKVVLKDNHASTQGTIATHITTYLTQGRDSESRSPVQENVLVRVVLVCFCFSVSTRAWVCLAFLNLVTPHFIPPSCPRHPSNVCISIAFICPFATRLGKERTKRLPNQMQHAQGFGNTRYREVLRNGRAFMSPVRKTGAIGVSRHSRLW